MNDAGRQKKEDFRWTDRTILSCGGEYQKCLDMMVDERKPWCIRSNLTLMHSFGMCEATMEFYDDGHIVIVDYKPSTTDYYANHDVRTIKVWASNNGWKYVEPHRYVVDEMKEFWKHMWQVNLIQSAILDRQYGVIGEPESEEQQSGE